MKSNKQKLFEFYLKNPLRIVAIILVFVGTFQFSCSRSYCVLCTDSIHFRIKTNHSFNACSLLIQGIPSCAGWTGIIKTQTDQLKPTK
jgi:hypothetical protein